jgi:hypothetical protein
MDPERDGLDEALVPLVPSRHGMVRQAERGKASMSSLTV